MICKVCGNGLVDLKTAVTTRKLRRSAGEPEAHATWGTAHFGPDNELVLYIPSESESITVLPARQIVLGRSDKRSQKGPDLDLSPYDAYNKGVSRLHAAITREEDEALTLVDLGSVNHTFLNGEQLIPHRPRVLRDGDEIRLGELVLRVFFK